MSSNFADDEGGGELEDSVVEYEVEEVVQPPLHTELSRRLRSEPSVWRDFWRLLNTAGRDIVGRWRRVARILTEFEIESGGWGKEGPFITVGRETRELRALQREELRIKVEQAKVDLARSMVQLRRDSGALTLDAPIIKVIDSICAPVEGIQLAAIVEDSTTESPLDEITFVTSGEEAELARREEANETPEPESPEPESPDDAS